MANHIDKVLIDELVILKILKHAKSSDDKTIIGQLHGFYSDNIVEVTHTYPLADSSRISISQADYDHQMSKLSEEVHLDNNKVGWYHVSSKSDNFVASDSFEQQSNYQANNPNCIYLIYDNLEALRGVNNPYKAYRVSDKYIDLSEQSKVNVAELKQFNTKNDKIFIPIPVEIRRNPLAAALISEYTKQISKKYENQYHSSLNISSLLQKNAHYLNESVEQLHEANTNMNLEFMKKSKESKYEKDVDPLNWIDNLLLLDRVHTLADNIIDQSKFVSESTSALKHIS
ncbi:hypothetical protein ABPG72_005034 [Tetrahymena utriculariae]